MPTRIEKKFESLRAEGKRAFIPYITAGDPTLEGSYDLVLSLEAAGADLIEIGVPFSDPIADGPVIQRATERALANGVSLGNILSLVERIRQTSEIPLMLMSYYNPLLNHGLERLAEDAARVGVDGILASDLTVEEAGPFIEAMKSKGLNTVFLVAPTSSPERVSKIARTSTGFLYAVARTGVTGETNQLSGELVEFIRLLKSHTDQPIAVGFGISDPEHVRTVWAEADGAVVGSAIVREIENQIGKDDMAEAVGRFVRKLRGS
jgi:tryptophan synthase alpha chain